MFEGVFVLSGYKPELLKGSDDLGMRGRLLHLVDYCVPVLKFSAPCLSVCVCVSVCEGTELQGQ